MRERVCLKQGPDTTVPHMWQTEGKTWWQSSYQSGKGRLSVIGGVEGSLAHWLPVKPKEGHAPHQPSASLSWWRCYNIKARISIHYLGPGVCRKSVMWAEGKWSRHWSSWGCTESKRTDILCDLTLQQKIQYPIKCFVPNKSFYLDKIFHVKDTKTVACPVKANEIKQIKIK